MKPAIPLLASLILLAGCGQSAEEAGAKLDQIGNQVEVATGDILGAVNEAAADVTGAVDSAVNDRRVTDQWIGRWVGVEGLVLDIARAPAGTEGDYAVKVTLMDGASDYVGTSAGSAITFQRDGRTETIRRVRGDETGLKWLAGKNDCLMIREGEGFCRD